MIRVARSVLLTLIAGSGTFCVAATQNKTSQDAPKQLPAGAVSAEECVKIFFTSMLDGDLERNRSVSLSRSHLDRLANDVIVQFGGAADRFRSKFVKTYGEEAWKKFNDPKHLPYKEGALVGANGSVTVMERSLIPGLVEEARRNATESRSYVRAGVKLIVPSTHCRSQKRSSLRASRHRKTRQTFRTRVCNPSSSAADRIRWVLPSVD